MKKNGILNAELNSAISRLGHGDVVIVADCGLPMPSGVPVVDLALVHGIPRFTQVLDALLEEVVFEACIVADEIQGTEAEHSLSARFSEIQFISHENLKRMTSGACLFVRTGEATAYANAALVCGVSF